MVKLNCRPLCQAPTASRLVSPPCFICRGVAPSAPVTPG
ncbi:hypothetical protein Milano_128 [Agrobacterium phage Milano]|nr:Chain a1, Linking protein 2, gp128 [Agrobacterium phage Milano]8FWG_a2 Chain a2, Linking protein 2, gp128 [Agrobacterium phage Milano]8FWG_a5 Chain a5, Linking protein 2, gp128 [Agrobacterium phage Milano]8FWG_a6 Chain a6, Linking protein 2, gp128 [Agrobacterium phage Milano]8FWG_a7 Chain a7, Linking protein 2, gp128 [Agrobacterium phage Milano]8FWG_b1 Chain b1, Linking protein 2, gp128 [Agrobacterium phage Milano]8FWG_b2 Chain b2, Linking protein 2, gp128 [Agrobacterium phage Milano]8FWG